MKTTIINIEPHDDFISVKDKMVWGKSTRTLLVWPRKASVLNRRLDLTLLLRHSKSLGTQLAIVSTNPEVRFHSRQLGIPIFNNPQHAQKSKWIFSRQRRKQYKRILSTKHKTHPDIFTYRKTIKNHNQKITNRLEVRVLAFFSGVLAILAIAAIFIPNASITISPQINPNEIIINLKATRHEQEIHISGIVPINELPITVEGRDASSTTGISQIPENYAVGEILLTNLTVQPITIPQGLVIRTTDVPPVRFQTTTSDVIPAGIGEQIILPIQSITPGLEGNIPANTLLAVEDALGINISSTNPVATSGGSTRASKIPSEKDRNLLKTTLQESLKDSALDELNNIITPDDILLDSQPFETKIIEQKYIPENNIPGDFFELNLRVQFIFQIVRGNDLHRFVNKVVEASIPKNQQIIKDSISFENVTPPSKANEDTYEWQTKIIFKTHTIINNDQIFKHVMAKTPAKAQESMKDTLTLRSSPEINIFPDWWLWMPLLPTRIKIIYNDIPH